MSTLGTFETEYRLTRIDQSFGRLSLRSTQCNSRMHGFVWIGPSDATAPLTQEHCARGRGAGCSIAKNPSGGRDAHTNRPEPREADAESQPTGAVHGGQPIAHSEHRDDRGGLRLRRSLYRPRAQPDLARNRGRRLRRGIGHGNHADCPGHLTRFARRDPHPRLRRPGGDGAACPECRRGQVDRRSLSLCAERPSLGYAAIPQAEVCRVLNEQTLLMAMIETPEAVENADAIAAVDGIDVLHIGASDLSTEMGIPGQYTHGRMRAAFETVARAAKGHGKAMGVGGVRQDFEFQSWLLRLGVRYLTGGSDVGYILSAGRADVKQLRELKLG